MSLAASVESQQPGYFSLDFQDRVRSGELLLQPRHLGVIARFVRRITLRARNTSIPTSTHRLSDSVSRCPANTELFGGSSG